MEPRYFTYVDIVDIHLLSLWFVAGAPVKGWLQPGDGILVSVVTQLGVTRPCVGRDLTVMLGYFSGHLSRGVSMWQWEVPWPDHLLEIQRNNTNPLRLQIVEPVSSGGSYSRHNIMVPMLAKIYILLSKCFPLCTNNNIKNDLIWFCVVSIFD